MSDRLLNNLRRRTIYWAGEITKLAKSYAPNHLKEYIQSHVEDKDDGTFIIRTSINRFANPQPNYGTLDARAQEYGSGLRARRGTKQKYLIRQKTAPFLEFQGTNEFDGWLIRTMEVKHPGIQAANEGQGYIGPAQKEVRQKLKAQLGKEVRDAIVGDLRESFGRKSK